MGKELSAGFDIAAVFSEASINSFFQLVYYAGLLPIHASTDFTDQTGSHTLELYFLTPTLEFVALPDVPNPVKLRFRFLAQVPTLNAQRAGAIAVFVSARKLQDVNDSDEPFNFISLDFTDVAANQFQFEPEPAPDLPFSAATTFGVLDESIVHDVAAPLAKDVLKNGIDKIPITPSVPSDFGFFTFRTYVDAGFTLPPQGTSYILPRVIGAYVNLDNKSRNPPSTAPLDLVQHIVPVPHHASYAWADADQIKIALPETLINAKLEDALVKKGLKPVPAQLKISADDEVTINALDVTLGNGAIVVQGDVDDVEFTVKFVLSFENDQLQSIIIDKDFDVPWYLDFLEVALPFVGSAIVESIELSIAKGLDSLGSQTGGVLGDINIFSNELPGVKLASLLSLSIHNNGDIEISPSGLVLQGQIETTITGSDIEQPFYVFGHLHSREFHRKGKGCPYLEKMKPKNTILFLSPAKALSMGYNGCRFCYQEYDVATAGRILMVLPGSPSGSESRHPHRVVALQSAQRRDARRRRSQAAVRDGSDARRNREGRRNPLFQRCRSAGLHPGTVEGRRQVRSVVDDDRRHGEEVGQVQRQRHISDVHCGSARRRDGVRPDSALSRLTDRASPVTAIVVQQLTNRQESIALCPKCVDYGWQRLSPRRAVRATQGVQQDD